MFGAKAEVKMGNGRNTIKLGRSPGPATYSLALGSFLVSPHLSFLIWTVGRGIADSWSWTGEFWNPKSSEKQMFSKLAWNSCDGKAWLELLWNYM